MSIRRITLVNLETLCAIARLGTFRAAADKLNTTQPAVSARVREVEDMVGRPLFQRRGRRIVFVNCFVSHRTERIARGSATFLVLTSGV